MPLRHPMLVSTAALVCALPVPACGSSADSGDETSEGATGSGETGAEETGTEEAGTDEAGTDETGVGDTGDDEGGEVGCPASFSDMGSFIDLPPPYAACTPPLESACDPVTFQDGAAPDPNALSCLLGALSGGALIVSFGNVVTSGAEFRTEVITLYTDGRAELLSRNDFDDNREISQRPAQRVADYDFAACASSPDWFELRDCILEGFGGCETWADDAALCGG